MRKYLFLVIGMALFAACNRREGPVVPVVHSEKKSLASMQRRLKPKAQPVEETLTAANIAYNTPKKMAYGETVSIHLVLDLSKTEDQLKKLVTGTGPVESDQIEVSHVVQATLTGDGFEITPSTNNSEQVIFAKSVTEWKWSVRAKRLRTQVLRLSLDTKVEAFGAERSRTVRVFDRSISVNITDVPSGITAARDNWSFLAGAGGVVVAVGGWLFKRLRKRPSAESNPKGIDHDQP